MAEPASQSECLNLCSVAETRVRTRTVLQRSRTRLFSVLQPFYGDLHDKYPHIQGTDTLLLFLILVDRNYDLPVVKV
jgi:hypothetical protein